MNLIIASVTFMLMAILIEKATVTGEDTRTIYELIQLVNNGNWDYPSTWQGETMKLSHLISFCSNNNAYLLSLENKTAKVALFQLHDGQGVYSDPVIHGAQCSESGQGYSTSETYLAKIGGTFTVQESLHVRFVKFSSYQPPEE